MTNPGINFSIKHSKIARDWSRVIFPEIISFEFEYLYISKTICSHTCSCIYARCPCWVIGIISEVPTKIGSSLCISVYEVEFRNTSWKNVWGISNFFVVFITDNPINSVFITTIPISIPVIVDKLQCILTISLVWPRVVYCSTSIYTGSIECCETSTTSYSIGVIRTHAVVKSRSVVWWEVSATTIVS